MDNKILDYIKMNQYKRHTFDMFFDAFQNDYTKVQLKKEIDQLVEDGFIALDKLNRYDLVERLNMYRGTIQVKEKGYGFVVVDDNILEDIFIPQKNLNGAFNKDKVLVKITKNATKDLKIEGKIIKVLGHGIEYIIGRFVEGQDVSTLIPIDPKNHFEIIVQDKYSLHAITDQIVKAEIIHYISNQKVECKVIEIIGHINDPGIDILEIVSKYGLNHEFHEPVMHQAQSVNEEITEEMLQNRRDLRDEIIFTIDGNDAKDLDDAISLTVLPKNKYKLGVYIADVSYYVRENTPIDIEAYERGTSVYLTDRVIPMIPHKLSNGVCSLHPNVDRLVIGCEMIFDEAGNRESYDIFEAVIHSKARMTYDNVNKILLDKDKDIINEYKTIVPSLINMHYLSKKLRDKRANRGGIDFEIKESYILVDETGYPIDIKPRNRLDAEKLIEDFMLVANEIIAEHFHWLQLPFIYRIHDEPNQKKLEKALRILSVLGYKMKMPQNAIHPSILRDILKDIIGTEKEKVINTLILRSMSKAKYSDINIGHYGLASDFYTHFTSPIRRYPDTIVHRLIREFLFDKKVDEKNVDKWTTQLSKISVSTSACERKAMECEREVEDMKKAEYMQDFVGKTFTGIISSVLSWGLFVELDNTVEGLVHVNELKNDYFIYDEEQLALIGRRTNVKYQIGNKVTVKVIRACKESKEIDFELVDTESKKKSNKKRKGPNFIKREEWVANKPKKRRN